MCRMPGWDRKHGDGFAHREVEHIGDGPALVSNRERLVVETPSAAHLAGHEDIGQEVHLHPDHPVSVAVLATPAGHVEGEAPRAIPLGACRRQSGEEQADAVENLRVGGRVGTRGAADGRLVNVHHPSDAFHPLDAGVRTHRTLRAVERAGERPVENLVHEVLLPAPETPVTQVKAPSGIRTSTSFRLFARAPTIRTECGAERRRGGTGISRSPRR